MAKTETPQFYALGPKASLFVDPATGLKISGDRPIEVTPDQRKSTKFKKALAAQHIVKVNPADAEKMKANFEKNQKASEETNAKEKTLEEMTSKELSEHFRKVNPDATEAELAKFDKLNKADKLAKLTQEDEEEEDEEEEEEEEDEDEDEDDE